MGQSTSNVFTIQVANDVSSVEDISSLALQLSPNPAAELVTIEAIGRHSGEIRIRLLNALGMEVFVGQQTVSAGAAYRYSVNLASLPAGMYMLEVQDGAERTTSKVMKN